MAPIPLLLISSALLAASPTPEDARSGFTDQGPVHAARGVAQLFVDDHLIDHEEGLIRTLHSPQKDHGGERPVLAPPELQTLMANGTILRDPRLDKHVMFAEAFEQPPRGRYRIELYRFTSGDGLEWTAGDDGRLERIEIDLTDAGSGRRATNIDLFSCWYDKNDSEYPYQAWCYFANWGDDLEGVWFLRSADGKSWQRVRQIVNGWAGGGDPSFREIRQEGRCLRGPGDVTIFCRDAAEGRFLGIFKFFSVELVGPGNRLRSRAYAFLDHIDEPFDASRLERIALLPAAANDNGDRPYDEYYGSTAWRYGPLWLGGLKIWHAEDDYNWSAAGCAFLKLVSSRDGLRWSKVPFRNQSGHPEVFLANGPEGGHGGRNDGGYLTQFSQGPLRIGEELVFYYGCSSFGKNHPPRRRISGGGIFRARLRIDGFVSLDAGRLTTPPLRLEGEELFLNAVGPVSVDVLDASELLLESSRVAGDSLRHRVRFQGASLGKVAAGRTIRLRLEVSRGGRLYSFTVR